MGTRRRGRPSEDDCAAALYSPADLPVGTRRRRGPFEDHGVAALYSPADLPVRSARPAATRIGGLHVRPED